MADPVVHITNGVPDSGTGNITTLGQTLLDGANATIGAKADAKNSATDTTAVSGISIWKQISASVQAAAASLAGTLTVATHAVTQSGSWVLSAGSALIGKVGIDQTTDGTTNKVAADLRVGGSAIDKGSGTGGSATPRIIIDSSQLSALSTTAQARSTGFQLIDLPTERQGSAGGLKVDDIFAQYETVAASATDQVMGATGATGDYLAGVLVFPDTAGCGVVTIKDNSTTIGSFAGGGTTALADLKPFLIPVGLFSVSGAWKITTGANVTAVGIGKFT